MFFLTHLILRFTFPLYFALPCFSFLSISPVAFSLYSPLPISYILPSPRFLHVFQRSLSMSFDTVACHLARNLFQLRFQDCRLMTRITLLYPTNVRMESRCTVMLISTPTAAARTALYSVWAAGWTTDESWFDSRQGREIHLIRSVQTGSGAHPASYRVDTGFSVTGYKATKE
jgi:hypothetical protein